MYVISYITHLLRSLSSVTIYFTSTFSLLFFSVFILITCAFCFLTAGASFFHGFFIWVSKRWSCLGAACLFSLMLPLVFANCFQITTLGCLNITCDKFNPLVVYHIFERFVNRHIDRLNLEQQNRFRATHVAIIKKYDAGRFDLKVFVNCRVQGEIWSRGNWLYKTEEMTSDEVMNNVMKWWIMLCSEKYIIISLYIWIIFQNK